MTGFLQIVARLAFLGCLIGSAWVAVLVIPATVFLLLSWWD